VAPTTGEQVLDVARDVAIQKITARVQGAEMASEARGI